MAEHSRTLRETEAPHQQQTRQDQDAEFHRKQRASETPEAATERKKRLSEYNKIQRGKL